MDAADSSLLSIKRRNSQAMVLQKIKQQCLNYFFGTGIGNSIKHRCVTHLYGIPLLGFYCVANIAREMKFV
jgi:hypothetical protein